MALLAGLASAVLVRLLAPTPSGRSQLLELDRVSVAAGAGPRGGAGRVLVAGAAAAGIPLLMPSMVTLVVAPVVAVLLWWWLGRVGDADGLRRGRQLTEQLPEALDLLVSALNAGAPTRVAVAEVAAVSPAATRQVLEAVASHIRIGRSEAEAWLELAGDPALARVWGAPARDLARNASSGAAVVEVLRVHAAQARDERRGDVEKQARTVGIRSVLPLMTCFLPAFVLVGVVPIIAGLVAQYLG